MASGTLGQSSAHPGDPLSGTYSGFTPTSCTIGGQAISGFTAAAGAWGGSVLAAQSLGVKDTLITDGVTTVDLGNITILAVPINQVSIANGVGL